MQHLPLELKYTELQNGNTKIDIISQSNIYPHFAPWNKDDPNGFITNGIKIIRLVSGGHTEFQCVNPYWMGNGGSNIEGDGRGVLYLHGLHRIMDQELIVPNDFVAPIKHAVKMYNKRYLQWKLDQL
jgi:hypothetical protein